MFALKIHTVDFPQPLHTTLTSATSTAAAHSNNGPMPSQLMGVAHLFRQLPSISAPPITIAHVSARTTVIFIVAVPNYLSADEFLLFCGKEVSHFDDILFLRNDAMEDRYSVLIRLENQLSADGFYCCYNGKRFKPTEVEVCHIYFAQSVENTDSAEIASIPPAGYTELPSCPVCLERLDPDTSGIQSTLCDHSFHCSCVSKWTLLSCPVCQLCQQQDEKPACAICGTFKNLWICLICGFVGCGRYEKGHASGHWSDKHHHFSLDLEKQQIWDYVGDRYVHRLNQSKADGKSVVVNSRCSSVDECGTCGYGEEDEGLDGALFSSKIEGILDEYNHLLAGQLDEQRQQYETLLAEAKSGKESSIKTAMDKAIFSKTLELEYKWEKYAEEKRVVTNMNQELMKKQLVLQNKFKEIEERTRNATKMEKVIDEIQAALSAMSTRVSVVEGSLSSVDKSLALILAKLEKRSASEEMPETPGGSQTGNKSRQQSGGSSNENSESSGDGSRGSQVTSNMPRMDLPLFDGSDPLAWLAQAEQYFLVHHTALDERVQLALIAMTGRSMFWAQWVLRRSSTIPWGQFAQELIERFGDSSAINAYEAMHLTRQTGSLEDYLSLFEERVAQLPSLPPEQYLGVFLGGLQPAIRERIPDSEMTDVFAGIRAARRIARSTNPSIVQQSAPYSAGPFTRPTSTPRSSPSTSPIPVDSGQQQTSSSRGGNSQLSNTGSSWPTGNRKSRHLTPEQVEEYRAKGKCFKCSQPYSPLHRCASKYLSVIIGAEGEEEGEVEDGEYEKSDPERGKEFGTGLQHLGG